MQEIITYIEQLNQEYAKLPLFEFLDDQSIAPSQKLSFASLYSSLYHELRRPE